MKINIKSGLLFGKKEMRNLRKMIEKMKIEKHCST